MSTDQAVITGRVKPYVPLPLHGRNKLSSRVRRQVLEVLIYNTSAALKRARRRDTPRRGGCAYVRVRPRKGEEFAPDMLGSWDAILSAVVDLLCFNSIELVAAGYEYDASGRITGIRIQRAKSHLQHQ